MARGLYWLLLARNRAGRPPTDQPPHTLDGPTPLDLAMMRRALALAQHAAAIGEVPVGAVVYETTGGKILGEGFNRRQCDKDPAAHAEFLAITRAAHTLHDWRLDTCSLAVTLEPCAMCAGLIVNARVARVLYGAADPKAGAVRSLYRLLEDPRLNHRAQVLPGVLARESSALLSTFFAGLRTSKHRGATASPPLRAASRAVNLARPTPPQPRTTGPARKSRGTHNA